MKSAFMKKRAAVVAALPCRGRRTTASFSWLASRAVRELLGVAGEVEEVGGGKSARSHSSKVPASTGDAACALRPETRRWRPQRGQTSRFSANLAWSMTRLAAGALDEDVALGETRRRTSVTGPSSALDALPPRLLIEVLPSGWCDSCPRRTRGWRGCRGAARCSPPRRRSTSSPRAERILRMASSRVEEQTMSLAEQRVVVGRHDGAHVERGVKAHLGAARDVQHGDVAAGREEVGGLGVDAALDGVAARWRCRPAVKGSSAPAATRSCHLTRSTPLTNSVTGCSTCRRVFISMK